MITLGKKLLTGCLTFLMLAGSVPSIASANAAASIQTVIQPMYDYVSSKGFDKNGLAVVGKFFSTGADTGETRLGVINKEGAYIVPIGTYDYIKDYSEGLASVDKGFIDATGKLVIAFPHRQDNGFVNGLCVIMDSTGHWGVIDSAGKVIIPCEYYSIVGDFSAGNVIGVKISPDQSRAIDYILSKSGTATEVDGIGDAATSSECSITGAIVYDKSKGLLGENSTGYVDAEGKQIIPYIYNNIQKTECDWGGNFLKKPAPNFDGNYLIATKGDYVGLLDMKGNVLIDFKYDMILSYSNGFAYVELNKKIGCIDKNGNVVLPFEYDGLGVSNIADDYVALNKNNKLGYADLKGNIIVPVIYRELPEEESSTGTIWEPSRGVSEFAVRNDEGERMWGCVDTKGNIVVPFEYQAMKPFAGGLAAVEKNDKWGYVDTSGKLVINTSYDDVECINCKAGGLNYVKKGGKWGFIDMNETPITPFEYYDDTEEYYGKDSCFSAALVSCGFIDGLAWVCKNGKYGLLKYTGTGTSSSAPTYASTPSTPTADSIAAKATQSPVLVDGKKVDFEAYNIGGSNYFKLRDIAKAITGSKKQFEIGFDTSSNAISITTGKAYTSVGTELKLSENPSDKSAVVTNSKILVNGKEAKLTAYNIGGSNYFKLRDLAAALDFGVTWDAASSTIGIDTNSGYAK